MAVKLTPQELAAEVNKLVPGAVKMASEQHFKPATISTNVLAIDYLLRGGLPRGRSVEIYGDYSTLKSYVVLKSIASTQVAGGIAVLVDTEHTIDKDHQEDWVWPEFLGVNVKDLILIHPKNGETAVDAVEALIRAEVDLVAFDSVAALLPKSEAETKISEKSIQPARLAALMSLAMRKLTAANGGQTALLWTNQTRVNVGITFGSPETTTGGKSLPFYASTRVSLRKAGRTTEDVKAYDGKEMKTVKETTRQTIRAFTEKNKLDRPLREVFFEFDLKTGQIDDVGFMVNLGLEQGVVTKNGAMWTLRGEKPVRGAENFRKAVDPNLLAGMLDLNGAQYKGSPGVPLVHNKPAGTMKKPRLKSLVPVNTRTAARGE